jgi:predicted small lipoprotein YifL
MNGTTSPHAPMWQATQLYAQNSIPRTAFPERHSPNGIPQTVARGYTAPMNRRSPLRLPTLLFGLLSSLVLAACGNKGPLLLPEKPTEPSAELPAETEVEPDTPQAEQTTGDSTDGQTDPKAETPPPPPALRGR